MHFGVELECDGEGVVDEGGVFVGPASRAGDVGDVVEFFLYIGVLDKGDKRGHFFYRKFNKPQIARKIFACGRKVHQFGRHKEMKFPPKFKANSGDIFGGAVLR